MRRVVDFVFVFVVAFFFTACGGGGGGGTSGTPIDPTTTLNGIAVDNYISGATVCIDTNKNNSCDVGETQTTTASNGTFSFSNVTPTDDMVIIAYGGTDAITGENFNYIIKNIATNKDSNSKVILSSLNTLITDYKFETNSTLDVAKSAVVNFLGSNSANIEVANVIADVIANKTNQNDEFLKSLKIFQMVASINDINDSNNSALSFKAIAKAIASDSNLRDTNTSIPVIRESISKTILDTIYKPVFLRVDSSKEYLIYTNQATSSNSFNFFEAYDPKGGSLSYSLVNTKDYDDFNISSTGILSFINPPSSITNPTDSNGDGIYKVDVNISNGLNYIIKPVEIVVKTYFTNSQITVPVLIDTIINIDDNTTTYPQWASIGSIQLSTNNDSGIIKYESNSSSGNVFDINWTTGSIYVKASLPNVNPSQVITEILSIKAKNSAGWSDYKTVTINIYNTGELNSTATIATNQTFSIYENNASQIVRPIGVLSTGGPLLTIIDYNITGGTGLGLFNISNDGNITQINSFNFESQSTYSLVVKAQNQNGWGNQETITVNILDVNEAPTIVSNQADYNISFGLDKTFTFNVTDGDGVVQNLTISSSDSNDTNIATIVSSSINSDSSLATFVINGKNPGTARISFTIQDDGGTNVGIGDVNTTNHYFDVIVRANGWKIYEDQKASNYTKNNVTFDDINYTWNSANRWYENNTSGTILMPLKVVDDSHYLGENLNYKADGHYDVNKTDYLSHTRITEGTGHSSSSLYENVNGNPTIKASDKKYQHDSVHHLFVSSVVTDNAELANLNYFDGWLDDNSSIYVDANDSNSSYATAKDSYAGTTVKIDMKNDGNDICGRTLGIGWRLPTSYEMGINISSMVLLYKGFIPAYVGGDGSSEDEGLLSSTYYDINKHWALGNKSGISTDLNKNGRIVRCVYGIF